jgi:hypothetical protein
MIQVICSQLTNYSEATVTLYPTPSFAPPKPLLKAKTAFSFAVSSTARRLVPTGDGNDNKAESETKAESTPTVFTRLLVGCRRKVVLYSWKDGKPQEARVRIFVMSSLRNDVDLDQGSTPPPFTTRRHFSRPRHCMFRVLCHRACHFPAVYHDSD